MKILFLDHQGVIYLDKAIWPDGKPKLLDFEQGAVSILNEIIKEEPKPFCSTFSNFTPLDISQVYETPTNALIKYKLYL
jgi:hypothetical protein